MASRSHVDMRASSDVNERRLRPIYDCLDNGNNKKAIQEADKVLKKQKDLQCAKVLKALALLRLGRHDDSSVMLNNVHAQHPNDEATLQAMAICYREIHKLDLIADMYENAHKSRPDNEEILSALFMAYVRLGDHKKQQQTAMLLHKLKPHKNPYYFWAVMSIVMQAHNATDKNLSRKMFLPLAERMTKKYVDDEKIEAEAEVQLYLIILELLEKWEQSLDLVEGTLGEKLISELNFREVKAAELYIKLEKWSQACDAYRKLLIQNPDHFFWWKEYIRSLIQLSTTPQDKETDNSSTLVQLEEKVVAFIRECVQFGSPTRPLRGTHVAQLELILQLQDTTNSDSSRVTKGDPVELIEKYFDLFGDRFCCYGDLKAYFGLLTDSEKSRLTKSLEDKVELPVVDGSITYADSIKEMQSHITCLSIQRHLGCHEKLSREDKLALAKELIDRHKHGLQFGTELLSTDLQFSDTYLLLAVALMLDIWQKHGDDQMVWQIIVQLELGLRSSPSSFQMKLLLIRLYCTQGAFGPCPVLYDGMEIKHIMNDTLGHIVSNHVGRLGHFMAACAMYGTMLRFFTVNHKETTEYLIASYKYGSFSKIHEFVKFRERLQNSLQYACATAERMLLDLVLETNGHVSTEQMIMYMEIDPEKDKDVLDDLCDNRDFTAMFSWDAPSTVCMKEVQEKSFQEEKAWLRLRNLTLRILAAAVMLGQEIDHDHHTNNGVTEDGRRPIHRVLIDLQTQLTNHIQSCQCWSQKPQYPVQGPFRTRLSTYIQGNFLHVLTQMLDNVNYIHSLQDEGFDKVDNEKEEKLKTSVPSLAEEMVEKHKESLLNEEGDRKSLNPDVLEKLVLCAETLSHMTVLAGVCYRMLKPVKTVLTRRNKKKKDNIIPLPCTFENFNTLITGLIQTSKDLHLAVRDIDPLFLSIDLSTLQLTESLSQDEEYAEMEREMWRKVERSYQQSVGEVSEFLHKKMQYLDSLRL